MNKLVEKIDDLRTEISMINFKEFLTADDYDEIERKEKEIRETEDLIKGVELYALELTHKQYKYSFFLTADKSLCCGDEPTWFDSEKEANEYLENANLDKNDYDKRIIKKVF